MGRVPSVGADEAVQPERGVRVERWGRKIRIGAQDEPWRRRVTLLARSIGACFVPSARSARRRFTTRSVQCVRVGGKNRVPACKTVLAAQARADGPVNVSVDPVILFFCHTQASARGRVLPCRKTWYYSSRVLVLWRRQLILVDLFTSIRY